MMCKNIFFSSKKELYMWHICSPLLFAVSPLVLTFHPLLLFSLSSHFLSNFTFSAPDKLQEKHVWVLRVICSLDLATFPSRSRSCRRALSLTVHCSVRLTWHHVCGGGEQCVRLCRCQHCNSSLELQQPSHLPCHIQGTVQEREEER